MSSALSTASDSVHRGHFFDIRPRTVSWRKSAAAAALIVAGLALGLLFSAQWQTKPVSTVGSPTESRREVALATIKQLEAEQIELKQMIGDLRDRIAAQQRQSTVDEGSLKELSAALRQQQLIAGMTALRGRGVRVVLDDSTAKTVPAGEDPAMYIIHEYQLRDVINQLWLAGAEAIALNDERIVSSTSIYCVGSTILVNDTRLSPPYQIVALGDPVALEAAINDPASLTSLKGRVKTYGIQLSTSREEQLEVPAYRGSVVIRHATTGVPTESQSVAAEQGKTNAR